MVKIKQKHKRYGSFLISMPLLDTELTTVWLVMEKLKAVVVEANAHYQSNSIKYTAISPLFDEIPDEETPPLYDLFVSKEMDGSITLEVERI